MLALSAVFASAAQAGEVTLYPAPEGQALSDDYKVTVDGKPLDIYRAPVWEPGYGVPSFGGPYSFAYFDIAKGPVEVRVTTAKPLDKLAILPASRAIKHTVSGDTATFVLDGPCQLSFEPDRKNGPLLLFANGPEQNVPSQDDPNVKYFGPGLHDTGAIDLKTDQTLYLAGGAVVRGGVNVKGRNIRICGRGVIDGLKYEKGKGPCRSPITIDKAQNVTVEGVILKDAWGWTFVMTASSDVTVRDLKIVAARYENNDGIDIVNCRNVNIEGCFIRSDDDCLTPKGLTPERQVVENVTASNCVLWSDRAYIWRFGAECRAEAMRNMSFRNIDVIHYCDSYNMEAGFYAPMVVTIQPAEDMPLENILFEDIRINAEGQRQLFEVRPYFTRWARTKTPGRIDNIVFRNITVTGEFAENPPYKILIGGDSPAYPTWNVLFDNVTIFGRPLTAESPLVKIIGEAHNVVFRNDKPGAGAVTAPATASQPHADIPVNNLIASGLVTRWNVAIFAVNAKPDRTKTDEYFRSTFDKDYLAPLGGEGKCVLTAGASVKYADETGAEKAAEVVPISANLISWILAPKGEANGGRRVAYAFCYIESDKDQKADFYFGGDDEANVWVNGAPVLKTYAARDAQARQDAFTVDLKKGLNPVLVKASQRSLNWQFVLEALPAPAK